MSKKLYQIFGCYNWFQIVLSTHRINTKKISRAIGIFYKIRNFVTKSIFINLYYRLIYPFLIYAVHIWRGTSDNNLRPLHVLQKRAVRLITNDSINPDGSRIHSFPPFYGDRHYYNIWYFQTPIRYFCFQMFKSLQPFTILKLLFICIWSL